jgi:hypothetical protein
MMVFLLGMGGVALYNKKANFIPIEGRVTKVETLCVLDASTFFKRGRSTRSMPCDEAKESKRKLRYAGYAIEPVTAIMVSYVSPIDKASRAITVERRGASSQPQVGAAFKLSAHKSDVSQVFSD